MLFFTVNCPELVVTVKVFEPLYISPIVSPADLRKSICKVFPPFESKMYNMPGLANGIGEDVAPALRENVLILAAPSTSHSWADAILIF